MKKLLKKVLPEGLIKKMRPFYHATQSLIASRKYGFPSSKLIVIGVTGTAGKSSTVNILAHILNATGNKTGFITTTNYSYGEIPQLNKHGLSMPNERLLQKQLSLMVEAGCKYAIIEATSEGLAQNRHLGINFDVALLTNLSPAHLEAHGGFENYKKAKGRLFASLSKHPHKEFMKEKMIGVNLDDSYADYFLGFKTDKYFGVSIKEASKYLGKVNIFTVAEVSSDIEKRFKMQDTYFPLSTQGEFSVYNAILAIATANMLGVDLGGAAKAMEDFRGVPGRMEEILNDRDIRIIVDYACEPKHFEEVLPSVRKSTKGRLIHVFGSTGGHRDISKRFKFGELSAKYSDTIIITNDDVYNSDPLEIANNIRAGISQVASKELKVTSIKIVLDRREAIKHALEIAETDDTILFTGKGSEQFLVLPGDKRIAWDEREVVRHELQVKSL